jgi:hypothetical protein
VAPPLLVTSVRVEQPRKLSAVALALAQNLLDLVLLGLVVRDDPAAHVQLGLLALRVGGPSLRVLNLALLVTGLQPLEDGLVLGVGLLGYKISTRHEATPLMMLVLAANT